MMSDNNRLSCPYSELFGSVGNRDFKMINITRTLLKKRATHSDIQFRVREKNYFRHRKRKRLWDSYRINVRFHLRLRIRSCRRRVLIVEVLGCRFLLLERLAKIHPAIVATVRKLSHCCVGIRSSKGNKRWHTVWSTHVWLIFDQIGSSPPWECVAIANAMQGACAWCPLRAEWHVECMLEECATHVTKSWANQTPLRRVPWTLLPPRFLWLYKSPSHKRTAQTRTYVMDANQHFRTLQLAPKPLHTWSVPTPLLHTMHVAIRVTINVHLGGIPLLEWRP